VKTETWDIVPKLDLISAIEADDWQARGAITELIANSFGEGRGNATVVTIRWDVSKRELTILDNGVGMQDVRDLLQLGQGRGVSHRDIGKWGYGGTKALIWLASEVHIYTLRDGLTSSVSLNWAALRRGDRWQVEGSPWTNASLRWTPTDLLEANNGTLIRLKLRREKRFSPSRIQEELAKTFAPGLRQDRHIVWETVRGDRIERHALTTAQEGHWQTWDLRMLVRDRELGATLYAGIDPELTFEDSALEICFGPQVIKRTRDCYQSPDKSETYDGRTLRAWVDLGEGWQDFLTNTKTSLNDAEAEDTLYAALFGVLRPILQSIKEDSRMLAVANIEANLSKHLSGLLDVDVPARPVKREPQYHWPMPAEPSGTEVPEIVPRREPDQGDELGAGNATKKERAQANVRVRFVPANKVPGLYAVSIIGDLISVDLDESNYYVRQAQSKKSPETEEMLSLLVVPAIADELLANDGAAARLLRPSVFRELQDVSRKRPWLLRLLLSDLEVKEAA